MFLVNEFLRVKSLMKIDLMMKVYYNSLNHELLSNIEKLH